MKLIRRDPTAELMGLKKGNTMARNRRKKKKLSRRNFFGDDGPNGKNRKTITKPLSKTGR